ncbi:DUF6286 domain-containing protein [Lentzea sp. BCCO 10_0798]|uniref:DUF6286 domain-containing protein n=1 Tax=Lentzea kristufekii TaxID=3095430 RepID=A0ABU4TRS0_9PSEU|nr:DUF6286 domain-containing protein [Lentzea sp. BCCO 10_0798]MDX8050979.1 DUF6286 domain-containing protein [Lentzea sp. BCCO 10_0798]
MKRRPSRAIPATVTALILLAAAVVVAVVAIQMLLHEPAWVNYGAVAGYLHGLRWTDTAVAVAGGAVAVLGLLLAIAAVVPGAPTVLPMKGTPNSGASSRGLRSTLRAAASTVDGVSGAAVALRGRRVKVRVNTGRTRPEGLSDAVRAAVAHRLGQIAPVARPVVSVRVHSSRKAL